MNPSLVTLRNFRGVNRKDGGERVRDDEFWQIQNWYQASKGIFQKRFGSTQDLSVAQIPGANRITGVHRHYNQNKEKFTLYHCEPDTTALPDNTTDLTLLELTDGLGTIFNGGVVSTVRVCYSWVGLGQEQNYNSKSRVGYLSTTGLDAWNQPGHQSITLSSNTSSLKITVPAFPSKIRAANVFVNVGTTCQMTYIGTVTTSGGFVIFRRYIGPSTARADTFTGTATATPSGSGSLPPGTYNVAFAWLVDNFQQENQLTVPTSGIFIGVGSPITAVVTQNGSSLNISHNFSASTNGANATYVFLGLKGNTQAPMTCVGIINPGETLNVTSIPDSNAQTHLYAGDGLPYFVNKCPAEYLTNTNRGGFLIKKDSSGNVSEVMGNRSLFWISSSAVDPINGGTSVGTPVYIGFPRTANDSFAGSTPYNWGRTVFEPCFAYLNGLSYWSNGADMPWETDGHVLGQITPESGTRLPPFPRFLIPFQNQLIAAGAGAGNTIYASNSLKPLNWAVGGTGTAIRFMSIGDLFGDDVKALGIFTLGGDAVNDPRDFFLSFKKHGIWMKDTFPDPVSGVGSPLFQLSGRIGCVAYRSIVSTPIGVIFLANDGNFYLIRSATQPVPIATSTLPIFSHLIGNDTLMSMVTAVYHDYHLKVSFPSSSTSTGCDAQMWADLRTEGGSPIVWTGPHTGVNFGSQIVLLGENDDESRIASLSNGQGTVKLDDVSTMADLGTAVSSVIDSKLYRFRDEAHKKRYLGMLIEAYYDSSFTHNLLVEFFADEFYSQVNQQLSSGAGFWDSAQFDQGLYGDALYQEVGAYIGQPNLVGRTLQFRITHSNPAQFVISAASLLFKPEKRLAV